ncbi:hypothetical protein YC2023_029154 [Brassica napus]
MHSNDFHVRQGLLMGVVWQKITRAKKGTSQNAMLPPRQLRNFKRVVTIKQAPVAWSWFIHQGFGSVSLEIKDTEVRADRTDPVQVRS